MPADMSRRAYPPALFGPDLPARERSRRLPQTPLKKWVSKGPRPLAGPGQSLAFHPQAATCSTP